MSFDVVILAAGLGLRLGPATHDRPKALVPVAGRPLVDHALAFARSLAPRSIVVVAGFRADLLRAHLAGAGDVRIVDNEHYRAGNLLSVLAGLRAADGGFLLTNVDHMFPAEAAARIAAAPADAIAAFCEFERPLADDEMKVVLDPQRRVVSIAKTLTRYDGGYIGLTRVPAARRPAYDDAARDAQARHGDAAVAEQVLQALADRGAPVEAMSFDGIAWSEVDTPEDLARAEARLQADPS